MATVLYDATYLHPNDLTGILEYETRMCGIVNNYPVGRNAVPQEIFELYKGSDRTLRVFVKTPDLDVIDITGSVGILTIKPNKESTVATISKHTNVAAEGAIGAADRGEMFFYLIPADTSSLDAQQYVFSVKITLSNGKIYAILEGIINLFESA